MQTPTVAPIDTHKQAIAMATGINIVHYKLYSLDMDTSMYKYGTAIAIATGFFTTCKYPTDTGLTVRQTDR